MGVHLTPLVKRCEKLFTMDFLTQRIIAFDHLNNNNNTNNNNNNNNNNLSISPKGLFRY